jgi:hypothetical protein
MDMNFKLKALVAAVMLTAAATAGAATGTTATTGSSMIFSAWDINAGGGVGASYSLDLGNFLNTFIGADVAGGVGTTNALNDSGFAYTGSVAVDGTILDVALTGFNLGTTGVWNLAAADGSGRNRLLTSEASLLATGPTNAQIKTAVGAVNGYDSALTAGGSVAGAGLTAIGSDLFYANSAIYGDDFGGSGITGSSNALGSSSNIYAMWQKSTTLAQSNAGFHTLTAGGLDVFGTTYVTAGVTHFKLAVAAVPEADTSAMMLAGLGLMGFIARRRNRKQA